jgi:hypothetical protein
MKTKLLPVAGTVFLLSTFNFQLSTFAQGTAFTYQGRLNDTGQPATGTYDLRFTIYDDAAAGNLIAGPNTNSGTPVANGLFTVTLDFGSAFDGNPRWLEIAVRTNGDTSFTDLSPRQELTPTPYAIVASDVALANTNIARLNVPNTARRATGVPIVTSDFITGATVTSPGSGYTTTPPVTVLDTTGSGAIITATVSNGAVVSLTVNNAGSGYSSNASLTIGPPPSNAYQIFSGSNFFAGLNSFSNPSNTFAGVFSGNGAGLTNLNDWRLSGNVGTTPAQNFLGTADNQALELRVNGLRAFRLEPAATNGAPNVVGGSPRNLVDVGYFGATVAGGGATNLGGSPYPNRVSASFGSIGGGAGNTVSSNAANSTIAGGFANTILPNTTNAFIGGGQFNSAGAPFSTVGGGVQNSSTAIYATVGGGYQNSATVSFATVGGGGNNQGAGSASTVAGGIANVCTAQDATVGGGAQNRNNGYAATIAGGVGNTNSGDYATVGGGTQNSSTNFTSTVGGGENNLCGGYDATVPGGYQNVANGNFSFAAGYRARALHSGSFVWQDSASSGFASAADNQFIVSGAGGVGLGTTNTSDLGLSVGFNTHVNDHPIYLRTGTDHNHGLAYCGAGVTNFGPTVTPDGPVLWGYSGGVLGVIYPNTGGPANGYAALTWNQNGIVVNGAVCAANVSCSSDRNAKENMEALDSADILAKVASLPISRWSFKQDNSTRHIGPMAQDFYSAFNVGSDDKHIGIIDEGGVALAAIQGLNQKVEEKEAEMQGLDDRLEAKEVEIQRLNQKLETKDEQIQELAHRLATLERLLRVVAADQGPSEESTPDPNE